MSRSPSRRRLGARLGLAAAGLACLVAAAQAPADAAATGAETQEASLAPDAAPPVSGGDTGGGEEGGAVEPGRRRRGSEFWLPFGSLLLPGLGQYAQGAPAAGLAFSGTAAGGYVLGFAADEGGQYDEFLPRSPSQQASFLGFQLAANTGLVSAYDSFHRSLPALRERGRYGFLEVHEPTGKLFDAPFETRFLRRKTTLIPLALTAALAGAAVVAERADPDERFHPFELHDGLFALGLSYNAGVAEEAWFRGHLLPLLHQNASRRFWLSNSLQALIFGAAHLSGDNPVPWVQTLFGAYQGWLTRRNGGSIRESIFQHFWYDVIVVSAAFLTDQREERSVRVRFALRF